MNDASDANIDLLIIVLVMAMTAPILFGVCEKLMTGDFGGFNTLIEKTATSTSAEIIPVKRVITRDDVMLMFAVADAYVQSPNVYDVNGTPIEIDDAFLANRTLDLVTAYSAMPDNDPKKMTLYVGPAGPRFWRIENE